MKKLKHIIIGVALSFFVFTTFFCFKQTKVIEYQSVDTIYVEKIIKDTIPILKEKIIKETIVDTLYVYLNDTIKVYLPVEIPMHNYTYVNDIYTDKDTISYKAFLSGYRASLDSIDIKVTYPHITSVTLNKPSNKGSWNYNIGLGIGYGLFNKKPDVYVGVGVGYTFK